MNVSLMFFFRVAKCASYTSLCTFDLYFCTEVMHMLHDYANQNLMTKLSSYQTNSTKGDKERLSELPDGVGIRYEQGHHRGSGL